MKTISKLFAVLALLALLITPAKAQNTYALSGAGQSLISYPLTAATSTNLNKDYFVLSANPGGESIIYWYGNATSGTNATQTNRFTVQLATTIGDLTTGPWYTNAAIVFDGTVGTNIAQAYSYGSTNLGAVKAVKIVKLTTAGTNAAVGTTATFKFGQHRPY